MTSADGSRNTGRRVVADGADTVDTEAGPAAITVTEDANGARQVWVRSDAQTGAPVGSGGDGADPTQRWLWWEITGQLNPAGRPATGRPLNWPPRPTTEPDLAGLAGELRPGPKQPTVMDGWLTQTPDGAVTAHRAETLRVTAAAYRRTGLQLRTRFGEHPIIAARQELEYSAPPRRGTRELLAVDTSGRGDWHELAWDAADGELALGPGEHVIRRGEASDWHEVRGSSQALTRDQRSLSAAAPPDADG